MDIPPIIDEQDSCYEVVKEDADENPIQERNRLLMLSGKKGMSNSRVPLQTEEGFVNATTNEVPRNTSFKVRKPLVMHQTLVKDLVYKVPRSKGIRFILEKKKITIHS